MLLLRRRIVASRWRLKTSWGCLIACRLLGRVSTTTSLLELVARRLLRLGIGGATLQRLACRLMNLPPIPCSSLYQEAAGKAAAAHNREDDDKDHNADHNDHHFHNPGREMYKNFSALN